MTFRLLLLIIAAVLFFLGWLVALGTITASGAFFNVHALDSLGLVALALGLAVGDRRIG